MIAMLRAAGSTLDLDECLRWLPADRVEASWRVGELRKGRPATRAGFNLLLSEDEDAAVVVSRVLQGLSVLKPNIKALTASGVGVEVDFGIYVQGIVPSSLVLAPTFLSVVAETGAELVFTAYPCSDEDE